MAFLHKYDCGQWRDGRCKGGPDFKVHLDEAKSQGYADEDTFAWADLDESGDLDRHEIHEFLEQNGVDVDEDAALPPSPAAAAGIRAGDVIVSADGVSARTVGSLHDAWSGAGATVAVVVVRDGEQVSLSVGRYGAPDNVPSGFLMVLVLVVTGLLVAGPVPVLGGLVVVWERKISGRMQSRPGPNRVGPNGWLQWLADGIKLIVKEDIIPTAADPVLFRLSPLLVFAGVFLTFVVIPFSPVAQVADLNIGILYLLSVTSIVVVGVIMGGWASNSKWSLLGGMRSAAQIVSYELPASVAILTVVVTVGSLSTQEMVRSQGGMPWEWNMFANPFAFVCFFVFFISALAEGNRTPFDLPEAESELVSGYNTEYSGFRFSIFALAEWVNLIVIGAFTSMVFLGGWNIPLVGGLDAEASLWLEAAAFVVFAVKVTAVIFVCIWIRWTLPRFRIDHMMTMCWKYFLPFSLVSFMGAAAWVWLVPASAQLYAGIAFFVVLGLGIFVAFVKRVLYASKTTDVWDLRGA
jgi:NADH-quinone oxidoreductase subunit H